ncbi:GHMP family kinase ATP-binding protein [Spirosoma validum]|uniref:GHMP kinase n=1 Tax=Spirosoma validum TaxID=2771355 RepID=A0A927B7D1_9BACT|nr:galactokinase family protein [Spirosoma validum]MBD2756810.1 GHMP kinase [Spirosoma validum]
MNNQAITVSTPGRICLFGEHQDYLGLPVIAAAISCRIQLTAERTSQPIVQLDLPDIGSQARFSLTELPLAYTHDRDYFRSAINVLLRKGFHFGSGIDGEVSGEIPINAGTSSSSALLITWLNVLSQLAENPQVLTPMQLAELAYEAEILEFGEPGGMMDHYSTAVGGVIYLESQPAIHLDTYQPKLGTFVLGNSQEPKDTIGILGRVKYGMLRIAKQLATLNPEFSLHTTPISSISTYKDVLTKDDYILLKGTLSNRDILREALALFQTSANADSPLDDVKLGQLLTDHHANLRDAQRISTPKIDRMLDAALSAGALGGKINGSGGGGCMFAYAPNNPETVAEAIERAGGRAYIVTVAEGTVSQPELAKVSMR